MFRSAWRNWQTRVAGRVRRWALRRHGPDPAELTLSSQRIYIVPTGAGVLYAVMLATMLAGSMNYNNNLGFALTFLLAGVGIAAIYHTHRNLLGLRIRYLGAEPGFAGTTLDVRFTLANDAREPRDEIALDWGDGDAVAAGVGTRTTRTVQVPFATDRRGLMPLPPLRVSTIAPLGLMRAWSWLQIDAAVLVYPRPAAEAAAPLDTGREQDTTGRSRRGDDDFGGLRAWIAGDSPRRIAWRQYARRDTMLVREYQGGEAAHCRWINWSELPPGDVEARVALAARLVIDAGATGEPWGLALPLRRTGPASGRDHLHLCLRELALFAPAEAVR